MAPARTSCKISILSILLLFVGGEAFAQAIDIPMLVTGTRGPDTWVNAGYAHQFKSDVDNPSNAEFSRDNVQFVAGHRAKLSDDWFMVVTGNYQGSYYNFDQGTSGGGFLRWSDIHRASLIGGLGLKASDDWTLVFMGLVRTDGESGADFGDTITGGGAVVVDYKWNEDLSTGLILGVISVLEDNAGLIPIPTVDWRFADSWLFHFGVVSAASYPGIGPEVSYRSEHWSFGFGGSYQTRRFRLDDDSGQPTDEGIGQERSFPVYVRTGYSPNENLSFGVMAGVALGGEIRSGTDGGRKIFKDDYDAAPIVGFNASYRF